MDITGPTLVQAVYKQVNVNKFC